LWYLLVAGCQSRSDAQWAPDSRGKFQDLGGRGHEQVTNRIRDAAAVVTPVNTFVRMHFAWAVLQLAQA